MRWHSNRNQGGEGNRFASPERQRYARQVSFVPLGGVLIYFGKGPQLRNITMRLMSTDYHRLHGPRRFEKSRAVVVAIAIGVFATCPAAVGATLDWHGGIDRNWSTPSNWLGNTLPVSGSPNLEVRIGAGSAGPLISTQDLGMPFELQQLTFENDDPFKPQTVTGNPIAFSNLGAAPRIDDQIFNSTISLTIDADVVLNADLLVKASQSFGAARTQMYLNGAISGIGGVEQIGGGDLFFGGAEPNSYAGMTKSTVGYLFLQKPASVVAIPGDLYVDRVNGSQTRSGRVYIMNDNQIASASTVTLNSATLYVEGGDQTLANVRFTGENLDFINADGGNVVISPSRTLTITDGITRTWLNNNLTTTSAITGGTLNLNGGLRSIRVDNGDFFWPRTELTISSNIVNGDIAKTGTGDLVLEGSFSGSLIANEGLLRTTLQLTFGLNDGGISNRISGSSEAEIAGTFVIDSSSLTAISGSWNLVDVANLNETFNSGLKVRLASGVALTKVGSTYKAGRWEFSTTDGNLTLAAPEPSALLLAMAVGVVPVLFSRRRLQRA